jgi:hypothetical protein
MGPSNIGAEKNRRCSYELSLLTATGERSGRGSRVTECGHAVEMLERRRADEAIDMHFRRSFRVRSVKILVLEKGEKHA